MRFGAIIQRSNVFVGTTEYGPYLFYSLNQIDLALKEADIIILAIALNDETKDLISRVQFEEMKPGAVLINAARGALVDETALIEALNEGNIVGAAIDVFAEEPLSSNSVLWNKSVFISSHNSFVSSSNHRRLIEQVISSVKACLVKRNVL